MRLLSLSSSSASGLPVAEMPAWRPPMNVFHGDGHFTVCVDLAGAEAESIDVQIVDQHLVIRGHRQPVEPANETFRRVLAMEIDQGPFERSLALPDAVEIAGLATEQRGGLFWIRLPIAHRPSTAAA